MQVMFPRMFSEHAWKKNVPLGACLNAILFPSMFTEKISCRKKADLLSGKKRRYFFLGNKIIFLQWTCLGKNLGLSKLRGDFFFPTHMHWAYVGIYPYCVQHRITGPSFPSVVLESCMQGGSWILLGSVRYTKDKGQFGLVEGVGKGAVLLGAV